MINNPAPTEPSLEELVRQMAMQNMQLQQETRASIQRQESSIQNLTTQMGQMATSLNTLQSHNSDRLPTQTMLNPRNVSAITLRSGKQTEVPTPRTNFAATKPSFATFFPSVLQAPDWTPPFDLECDIAVYALGTVLA
ncbi:hypothetical protein Lal_00043231, partial [Lupinus albus]